MLPDYKQLHLASICHEAEIKNSQICGCFDCLSIFEPQRISEWIDELSNAEGISGRTAVCPICGTDSVLPDSSIEVPLDQALLEGMHQVWCQVT
ncbi:hypothetical protein [[Leptolyngbya] sp. PCC 7376]|uniref:hypothetical protein n=1 Tax=[Leptolyngbya] sp. PCC 7376 TaxID=111781 RepID=UPI0005A0E988|nr:hypothetical protein [[Leptolyngbya] sp. PCC 7376]